MKLYPALYPIPHRCSRADRASLGTVDQNGGRVLIASNRGPVSFAVGEDGSLVARRGAGGLVSGLSSVRDHADVLWVCAALSDADRAAARSAPDGRIDAELTPGKSAVRMLDIPAATFQRAYNSVANSTLWFVHHMLFDTPNEPGFGLAFRREWESFRAYNAAFADALAEGAGPGQPARAGQPGPGQHGPGEGDDPGLSPAPGAADARRAAA